MTVASCAKCLSWLKKLAKTRNVAARRKFFKLAPRNVLNALREIIKNILNGKIKVKSSQKTVLKRYKNTMRKLSNNKYSIKKHKSIFVQKGGFLPSLLLPIISLLASTIADKYLK